jgi:O-acetyl-ADP-ribose deacetylase (regulator of RNase III)
MNIGTLKIVEGDVTNPQRQAPNEIVIIPHCCNDLGVMGAGVALSLKKKWPQVEEDYIRGGFSLGKVAYTHILDKENENIHTIIANMTAQKGVVGNNNPKPIKYQSLVECMNSVYNLADAMKIDNTLHYVDKNVVIHCPKFGSDLAGGDFRFIFELIREIWLERGIDVVIYEFVPSTNSNIDFDADFTKNGFFGDD